MPRPLYIDTGIFILLICLMSGCQSNQNTDLASQPIDRFALVNRHNPVVTDAHPLSPLSLGNGEFAFTADITGLQSFPEFYSRDQMDGPPPGPNSFQTEETLVGSIPLVTQSQWGWHTFPNPDNITESDAIQMFNAGSRGVAYASGQNSEAGSWLRQNPHRLNLARIGFDLRHTDGSTVSISELENTRQELDLWRGTLYSQFEVNGYTVNVETRVHPDRDQLSIRVEAPELNSEHLTVTIEFPYAVGIHSGDPSDWSQPDLHHTTIINNSDDYTILQRSLDNDQYFVGLSTEASTTLAEIDQHTYRLSFDNFSDPVSFSVIFSKTLEEQNRSDTDQSEWPKADETAAVTRSYWQNFWNRGAAIDLSQSRDPRAHELERRIVLSQYLTAIQTSGSLPPQETGLTYNSWFGKFHLEMHWWHGVHYALWDRLPMLENSLDWYTDILPEARDKAVIQGYDGVRWPKMTSPDGRDSPSTVGVFLIWQQPHPIYFSELVYRNSPTAETLDKYREIVFETAEFMASYPEWDEQNGRYILGAPLIPAQEIHPATSTLNPGFELAYWNFGLETAQIWRERLGMERHPEWDDVLSQLSPLPTTDSLYVNTESAPNTFSDPQERRDHPTVLGSCGFLPCNDSDREMMRRTLLRVMADWNWDETWGWDYPLTAMTAARVGEPEIAIDALMMDVTKNTYLPNGHNYQDSRLTIYLPGNGGLLTAVAMMAAGWDSGPDTHAPGFPEDDSWVVQWENLNKMP